MISSYLMDIFQLRRIKSPVNVIKISGSDTDCHLVPVLKYLLEKAPQKKLSKSHHIYV